MGKQEFADGGFTGKVGQVIGQFYNGQYYIRTYTKSKDARSTEQLKSRYYFAFAVDAVSCCLNVNTSHGGFVSATKRERNLRMSQCLPSLYSGGINNFMPPFFVNGTETDYGATNIGFPPASSSSGNVNMRVPSLPSNYLNLECIYAYWSGGKMQVAIGALTASSSNRMTFGFSGLLPVDFANLRFAILIDRITNPTANPWEHSALLS